MRGCVLWVVTLCLCSVAPAAVAQQPAALRRFVLSVGANDGGASRVSLRYAHSDARGVASVMGQLGGVDAADVLVLHNPSAEHLQGALTGLAERMELAGKQGRRVELLFYYSGHSDETGLRLGEQLVTYRQLRTWLAAVPADVRVGVLDSCASGALTRLKGGKRRAPFVFDESSQVRGHAFLTSSSEDEAAQESDRIGGSFFTHYFVSGLRGAADASGDGKVTLTEVYQFAFEETLARTGQTQAGAQHAAYDIQLVGTGDLVLTDLRSTRALLRLQADVEGRLFIRDGRGQLAAELYKARGRAVELGLPDGDYRLLLDAAGRRMQAQLTLHQGRPTSVALSGFSIVSSEGTVSRGTPAPRDSDAGEQGGYERHPVVVAAFSTGRDPRLPPRRSHFSFNLVYGRVAALEGLQLSMVGGGVSEQMRGGQVSLAFNEAPAVMEGLQVTVGANYAGAGDGLQVAAGFNVARQNMQGLQIAAGLNFAPEVEGLQIASGVNLADNLRGLQVAVGPNVARTRATGIQVSSSVNYAGLARGLQLSMVNVASRTTGLQLGVVNVGASKSDGLQLGVINYSEDASASLGLLSISRKHGVSAQVSTSAAALLQASFVLDARYTYSFFSAGVHPLGPTRHAMAGVGLGGRVPLTEEAHLELDVAAYMVFLDYEVPTNDRPNTLLMQGRLLAEWRLTPWLAVLAGPTADVTLHTADEAVVVGYQYGYQTVSRKGESSRVRVRPGFALGIQL